MIISSRGGGQTFSGSLTQLPLSGGRTDMCWPWWKGARQASKHSTLGSTTVGHDCHDLHWGDCAEMGTMANWQFIHSIQDSWFWSFAMAEMGAKHCWLVLTWWTEQALIRRVFAFQNFSSSKVMLDFFPWKLIAGGWQTSCVHKTLFSKLIFYCVFHIAPKFLLYFLNCCYRRYVLFWILNSNVHTLLHGKHRCMLVL